MSVQNVKAFFEKVQSSESLRAEMKAVNGTDRESAVAAIIQIATRVGLPFTPQDYEQATTSHAGPPKPGRR